MTTGKERKGRENAWRWGEEEVGFTLAQQG